MEAIYFFAVDDRNIDLYKIGRTSNIINRLNNYNVGRIKEVDLKYFALVKNSKLIEKCIKLKLKKNQFKKNKEIYHIEPEILIKVINECYCKNVSNNQNNDLYEELSRLYGLYSYVKDKKHIRPYVIIGSNL